MSKELNFIFVHMRIQFRFVRSLFSSFLLITFIDFVIISLPSTALEKDKLFSLPKYKEAYAKLESKDYKGALVLFQELVADSKESAGSYYGIARSLQELGDNQQALQNYNKSLVLDPFNAKAFSNRGLIKGALGDLRSALDDFNNAIRLDPKFHHAYSNRGVTRGALGDLKGAVADFNKAISINMRYGAAWRNRGISREIMGDLKGACEDWRMAAKLGQSDVHQWIKVQCQ